MTRTTPPRPLDVEALFPALAPLVRNATRLHPRRGTPTVEHSSIGGPVLWPAGEPWPVCPEASHRIISGREVTGPVPLVPVLQLFARDVPTLPHPTGMDLLQLLWCPVEEFHALDRPLLLWRDSTALDPLLELPPAPHPDADNNLVPRPCVFDPEPVTDYPYADAPEGLRERLLAHDEPFVEEEEEGWSMWDLLIVPGCKVGGFPSWTQEPDWPICARCGGGTEHLLTLTGWEGDRNWIPREEWAVNGYTGGIEPAADQGPQAQANRAPLDVSFGDNGGLYLFACTACPEMPLDFRSDCH
ncbi:DUF1963 domain-containing protein [Streptomyces hokutonensis]|uniref:DUF1963 domain-containing protein n=1 Tax=Streptomyces hokutonensis TaxID=1306990 RepID=UPI00367E8A98